MSDHQEPWVLIAEDNEINQQVVAMTLDMNGTRYEIVGDGAAAVSAWQEKAPSIILMDVSMPGMSGIEASQRIRELEQGTGQHVPIIACTAHALRGDEDRCLAAGMDDYISKPITPDRLIEKVERWLGQIAAARKSA
jgi:CheY-like chemotaxis protein